MKIYIKYISLSAILFLQLNCKKLVEVDTPNTSINAKNVYANDGTAISVVTGIYSKISNSNLVNGGLLSLSFLPALSADELTLYGPVTDPLLSYYRNSLRSVNTGNFDFWLNIYPIVYSTNAVIDGISKSSSLTSQVQQQLLGEAKFLRAFCLFYLVNLYGDVPLTLSVDYTINAKLTRSSVKDVYEQIVEDLIAAKSLLSEKYLDATLLNESLDRVRPNKWTASALLARVYLYTKNFESAASEASNIIEQSETFSLKENLNEVFLKNSSEAIWQIQPVSIGWNTQEARLFVLPATGPSVASYPVYLSQNLLDVIETGDLRLKDWVGSTTVDGLKYSFPYKYKSANINAPLTEYSMVFRLAELYLIRAEAKINQNDISSGIGDLNVLRKRARAESTASVPNPLPDLSLFMSKEDALKSLLHERQIELFCEWGHRWFDLKRSGAIDSIMTRITSLKGGTWKSTQNLYPIPINQIELAPNIAQNSGY